MFCRNRSLTNCFKQCLIRNFRQWKHFSFSTAEKQPHFGICFDIDGVLARGHVPFDEATKAIELLKCENKFKVPVAFVTNALAPRNFKTLQLQQWLKSNVHPDQVIMAQTPLRMYKHIRKKHALMLGQGALHQIATDLSLENVCMIEDLIDSYPLLDVGLHDNRQKVAETDVGDKFFPPVEVIILMGEPKHWETPLQVILDLLLTEGQPVRGKPRFNKQTVPVIACNLDLQYMHRASFPRFGHGAFLLCLEELFKKVTGTELRYDALIGKPSEVTMRFTEHRLALTAKCLGYAEPLKTMYMIGDNQDVDITAANMYQNYINNTCEKTTDHDIPPSRIPVLSGANLFPQTVTTVRGVLVKTGVYNASIEEGNHCGSHSHRDFPLNRSLTEPYAMVDHVYEAVQYILEQENWVLKDASHL